MAMLPFCGYNFADYWAHWLRVGEGSSNMPRVFHVNWFRQDADGRYLWPGFGENLRVLRWIVERCSGEAAAKSTAIGNLPTPEALDLNGLDIDRDTLTSLLDVDVDGWRGEVGAIEEFFAGFADRLPPSLRDELGKLHSALED
jgi:phosphoenolpyruvate carboxykinase (GTP)